MDRSVYVPGKTDIRALSKDELVSILEYIDHDASKYCQGLEKKIENMKEEINDLSFKTSYCFCEHRLQKCSESNCSAKALKDGRYQNTFQDCQEMYQCTCKKYFCDKHIFCQHCEKCLECNKHVQCDNCDMKYCIFNTYQNKTALLHYHCSNCGYNNVMCKTHIGCKCFTTCNVCECENCSKCMNKCDKCNNEICKKCKCYCEDEKDD